MIRFIDVPDTEKVFILAAAEANDIEAMHQLVAPLLPLGGNEFHLVFSYHGKIETVQLMVVEEDIDTFGL